MDSATIDAIQTTNIDWPQPIPIQGATPHGEALPYPAACLPARVQDAVIAYQRYGQQPLPLIACSALANVSLACQTLGNIARDALLISPVSLYFLVVAASGERKSASDSTFGQAIRHWQQQVRERLAPEVQVAKTLHQAWFVEKEAVLSQIRRAALTGTDTHFLKKEYLQIMEEEPEIPLLPTLFFEDATQEALASHIAHGWPSASLWSDEGGIVMGGHAMQANTTKFVALLNRLWDGKSFIAHRKTSQSFTVEHRRLTVSLMLQPLILNQLLAKNDGISRQSGFLARSLLAYPISAMGERYYQEPPQNLDALPAFHQRLKECLDATLDLDKHGCHKLPTLYLSSQAKTKWIQFFNHIESGLNKSQQWQEIKDFASKSAENGARLAALFHLFEGKEGEIQPEQLEAALEIIHWHLLETRRILVKQENTQSQEDSIRLLRWLVTKDCTAVTSRYLQQYSPIRDKEKLSKAIQMLVENHHLRPGSRQGKSCLLVNPKT